MLVLSSALISIFVLLAVGHLVLAYHRIVKRKPGFSSVPLLNGLIGAAGLYLFPDPERSKLWWVAFLVDWGCVPLLVESVIWNATRGREMNSDR